MTAPHRFIDHLRAQSEPTWSAAVGHRFVTQLCDGSLPDPVMGERVCAVVVAQPGQDISLQDLVGYLKDIKQVASFKWPEKLILLDELPRNPVGKVLKRELRAMMTSNTLPQASTHTEVST